MLLLALVLIPAVAAAGGYGLPARARRTILVGPAVVDVVLVGLLWTAPGRQALAGWVVDDALGRIVLTLVSVLFLAIAHYAVGYLREDDPRGGRAFCRCMLGFLAAGTLVALTHQFAL